MHRLGGCFPGGGKVRTPEGPKQVSSLKQGDLIQVMSTDGVPSFSPVLMMIHQSYDSRAEFLQVNTAKGTQLKLTASHLLLVVRKEDNPHRSNVVGDTVTRTVFAGQLREGDYLLVEDGGVGALSLDYIVNISRVVERGVFAPLTYEGNLIIDDAVVSCYAIIDSQTIAHWSFLPVRVYYGIKGSISYVLEALHLVSPSTKLNRNSSSNLSINNNKFIPYKSSYDNSSIDLNNKIEDRSNINYKIIYRTHIHYK